MMKPYPVIIIIFCCLFICELSHQTSGHIHIPAENNDLKIETSYAEANNENWYSVRHYMNHILDELAKKRINFVYLDTKLEPINLRVLYTNVKITPLWITKSGDMAQFAEGTRANYHNRFIHIKPRIQLNLLSIRYNVEIRALFSFIKWNGTVEVLLPNSKINATVSIDTSTLFRINHFIVKISELEITDSKLELVIRTDHNHVCNVLNYVINSMQAFYQPSVLEIISKQIKKLLELGISYVS